MRSLLISGVALGATALFTPAAMAADAPASAIMSVAQAGAQAMGHTMVSNHWGTRVNGRWIGGMQAPGGWAAYRRPMIGAVLPSYWIGTGFVIGNFGLYGLPAPQPGYVWARYYDDAVLIDRNGRVYDSRRGVDWDRYEDGYAGGPPPPLPYGDGPRFDDQYVAAGPPARQPYDDGGYAGGPPPPTRHGNTEGALAGAVVGGVVGGVAGNVIAGHGNRTAGTVIGAGLGAVAGAAIGSTANNRSDDYPRGAGYRDGPPPMRDDEERGPGPMRGPRWMADGPPPPMGRPGPMPMEGYVHGSGQPRVTTYTTPGYAAGRYWYPGTTVTTIVFPPAVTTVTTTRTVTYVPRRVVHRKPRCGCK